MRISGKPEQIKRESYIVGYNSLCFFTEYADT